MERLYFIKIKKHDDDGSFSEYLVGDRTNLTDENFNVRYLKNPEDRFHPNSGLVLFFSANKANDIKTEIANMCFQKKPEAKLSFEVVSDLFDHDIVDLTLNKKYRFEYELGKTE